MKNDPIFKFVAAAIFAAVCTAFYSATHFQSQVLYHDAVETAAATESGSSPRNLQTTHPGAWRRPS
jgi:hypothetical protein